MFLLQILNNEKQEILRISESLKEIYKIQKGIKKIDKTIKTKNYSLTEIKDKEEK